MVGPWGLAWLTALPVGDTEIDEETFRRVFGEGTSHGLISRMWFGFAEGKIDRRKSRHWQPPAARTTSCYFGVLRFTVEFLTCNFTCKSSGLGVLTRT
jgi:hypothetical protein